MNENLTSIGVRHDNKTTGGRFSNLAPKGYRMPLKTINFNIQIGNFNRNLGLSTGAKYDSSAALITKVASPKSYSTHSPPTSSASTRNQESSHRNGGKLLCHEQDRQ
ncbi:MAG: hypothetical protein M2R45_00045 [Verrucomicrobia subdivision 3 bacterium]|nr:hypothetical protein [Limisphaerales bacterium]MCS1412496.1 hypothetical protein [Limisphaerales bacterium]